MAKLFSYSSKVEIPLYMISPEVVEKFIKNLQSWLSDKSGETSDRIGNNIYFAINPTLANIFLFQSIDSGEVKIVQHEKLLIVEYRLSYLFPFLAVFMLDLFFLALFYWNIKTELPIHLFLAVTTITLFLNVGSTIFVINIFPNDIIEIWNETRKTI